GAAGQRKGVDDGVVEHAERPGQVRPLGGRGEAALEVLHVALERGVRVEAERGDDLPVVLAAHLDLLRLADERELSFSRGGVTDAGRKEQRRCEQKTAELACGPHATSLLVREQTMNRQHTKADPERVPRAALPGSPRGVCT